MVILDACKASTYDLSVHIRNRWLCFHSGIIPLCVDVKDIVQSDPVDPVEDRPFPKIGFRV